MSDTSDMILGHADLYTSKMEPATYAVLEEAARHIDQLETLLAEANDIIEDAYPICVGGARVNRRIEEYQTKRKALEGE